MSLINPFIKSCVLLMKKKKKKDTMAFGDGGNDKQMLQHVSLAIAMGNAGDELKSIADFVTKDVDDDGVAYALKHYGLIDL